MRQPVEPLTVRTSDEADSRLTSSTGGGLDKRAALRARLVDSHGPMLLTLVSIVQGAAFSYLTYVVLTHSRDLDALGWILAATTFLLVVIAWNEYFMGITSIDYIPDLFDSLLVFMMGIVEVLVIRAVINDDPRPWLLAMAGFSVLSSISFANMYVKGRKVPENLGTFEALGGHVAGSLALPLVAAGGFLGLSWLVSVRGGGLLADFAVGAGAAVLFVSYIARTLDYWRRIVTYATSDEPHATYSPR